MSAVVIQQLRERCAAFQSTATESESAVDRAPRHAAVCAEDYTGLAAGPAGGSPVVRVGPAQDLINGELPELGVVSSAELLSQQSG